MRRRTRKAIINYVVTFIMMLSIMCISLSALGKYSMLSVYGVMHTCDRIDYYNGVQKEIRETANQMAIPFGIDKKCLKGAFPKKQIQEDMTAVLKAQLNGENFSVDTKHIADKITKNVENMYGPLDNGKKQSLNQYIQKNYQKKMVIPYSDVIVKIIPVSTNVALIGIPVWILIILLVAFYLISSQRHAYKGVRFIVYAVWGAGVTLVTIFAALISNGFIYKFNISDVYMRKFYTYWIGHEMLMQVFAGIGLLFVGAVLIYVVMRQKAKVMES